MKHYKEFRKIDLGFSDIASVTIRGMSNAIALKFGIDSDYSAYLVEGEAEIGGHYSMVAEMDTCWVKVYDDVGMAFKSENYCGKYDTLRIYRAGQAGCILQFIKIER